MIYMEPSQLGWRPLMESWLHTLPHFINHSIKTILTELCDEMIPAGLNFVRKSCRELVETSQAMRVASLLRFLGVMLHEFEEEKNIKVQETWVKGTFLFCYIWSLGSTLDSDSRVKFDKFLRVLHANEDTHHPMTVKFDVPFPEEYTVYDYLFEVCV
jgi:dynein heavy chain